MANQWGISPEVERAVSARDKVCVYCSVRFGTDRKTAKSWEHIDNDIAHATLENIALCCIGCNASKGAKKLSDWIASPHAKRRGVLPETISPVIRSALANSSA